MDTKSVLLIPKIVAVWLVLTACYIVGTFVAGLNRRVNTATRTVAAAQAGVQDPTQILLTLLLVCLLITLVVSYIILRSHSHGWKLAGAAFLAMYGVMTVVSQIETVIYMRQRMPPGMIPKVFLMGAVVAALFAPLAVLILGKMRVLQESKPDEALTSTRLAELVVVLLVTGVVYLVLYMGFGYFVAWKNPAVREYYGGTDPGSFLGQMKSIWESRPWIFLLQASRGVLWALFVLPLIRLMKRSPWETAFAMALFCGVWSSLLLFPNPLMPEVVARIHFKETLCSNLIFGAFMGLVLTQRPVQERAR